METSIIPIGNSRGIRIPKAMLEEGGFSGKVNLALEDGALVVRPVRKKRKAREGWEQDAALCHARGDDALIWPEDMQDEYLKDWQWPEPE